MLILIAILLVILVLLQAFMAAAVYFERDRRTFREVREDRKVEALRREETRERSKAELEHEKRMREVEAYDGTIRKR